MNAILRCLAEGASSLRSSPKQLVRKEREKFEGADVGLAKVSA